MKNETMGERQLFFRTIMKHDEKRITLFQVITTFFSCIPPSFFSKDFQFLPKTTTTKEG
jgi:hypothetical protein